MIGYLRKLTAVLAIAVSVLATNARAQDVDFDQFDRIASAAEQSVERGTLPDSGFEALRDSMVEWREKFLDAQSVNSVQIETLDAQINALGPAPPEGETEAEDVAVRREQLTEALRDARAPRLEALEGFARANAIIGQIDTELRARQTRELLELQRSPLDPSRWPAAFGAVVTMLESTRVEFMETLRSSDRTGAAQRLAIAFILIVVAFLAIFRGPSFIERLLAKIEDRDDVNAPVVYGFLVSFAAVLSAMVGVTLLTAALIATGLLGETGRALAVGINTAILAYAIARWLGGRIFPERSTIPTPLQLAREDRAIGRRNASVLGFLAGLASLVVIVQDSVQFDRETLGVLTFPIFVILGLVMYRTGRLIWRGAPVDDDGAFNFSSRLAQLLGRAVQLVAVAAPLLAAIGYFSLASGVMFPLVLSLGLIAFLLAFHHTIRAGFALIRGLQGDAADQALTPVVLSLLLAVASLPIFALIWGARSADLGEVWTAFRTGLKIGDTTLSPGVLLTFAIVFAIGLAFTRLVQGTLRSSVLPRTSLDKGGQNAIVSGLGYVGITLAAVFGLTFAGIDLSSFAIVVGALGVGIGFGLQNIVNNFVSGIILLIERPISEGDWVEVGGNLGIVKSISVRSTRIEMFDRTDVIVPNGDLISGTVTNWTHGNSAGRVILNVGVAYGSDTKKVEAILLEIAENHPLVAVTPPPTIVFQGFGADSLDFEIRIILNDIAYGLSVRTDINHEIVRRFTEEGIEIPFAQRDIWLRNPEALRAEPQEPREPGGPVDPAMIDLADGGDLD